MFFMPREDGVVQHVRVGEQYLCPGADARLKVVRSGPVVARDHVRVCRPLAGERGKVVGRRGELLELVVRERLLGEQE
jgi:hypothetical protein